MMPGLSLSLLGAGLMSVVPNAVTWADIDGVDAGSGSNAAQEIAGIGESIFLRCELSSVTNLRGAAGTIYAVNDVGSVQASCTVGDGDLMDIMVAPGGFVGFVADGNGSSNWAYTATATIKYRLAGSGSFTETLDAFGISVSEYSAS